jgi:hypothetical protein
VRLKLNLWKYGERSQLLQSDPIRQDFVVTWVSRPLNFHMQWNHNLTFPDLNFSLIIIEFEWSECKQPQFPEWYLVFVLCSIHRPQSPFNWLTVREKALPFVKLISNYYIWGSYSGCHEEFSHLVLNIVCPLKVKRRFGGTCRLHLQGWISLGRNHEAGSKLWFLPWSILRPWRWMRHVAPKRRLPINGLHGIVYQKTEFFMIPKGMLQIISVDAVRLLRLNCVAWSSSYLKRSQMAAQAGSSSLRGAEPRMLLPIWVITSSAVSCTIGNTIFKISFLFWL